MEKWIIISSSILALAFICWKELTRKNKSHLGLRLAASVLAVAALYLMIQPASFRRTLKPEIQHSAVLLTEGFEKDSLTSFTNLPVFSASRSITAKNKNVHYIIDLAQFIRSNRNLNKIHILGSGLDHNELPIFDRHELTFHPTHPGGFNAVHWNKVLRSGERFRVQGTFKKKFSGPAKILLKGLSTTLDSTEITVNESFTLNTTPKLLGKAVYSLIALSGKDTLANEKLPLYIESKKPLKILILSAAPNFEYKFLKNWLYDENYALAVRNSISKDKYSTEFLNTERVNLNAISSSLLENFDVLVGDLAELSRLSAGETAAVQNQLSKGMGLLIRADSTGSNNFFARAFAVRQNLAIDQKNVSLTWAGQAAKKVPSPSGQTLLLAPRPGEQAMVKDDKGHLLVSSRLYGAGRMVLSTVADTYTWTLSGNSAEYSSYWSYLLGKAARKTRTTHDWAVLDPFPVVNHLTALRLEYPSEVLPSASADALPLRFAQDPGQLYRWTASYWPSYSGWHVLNRGTDQSFWYVYRPTDWLSVRAAQKIKNTQQYIASRKTTVKKVDATLSTYDYTIPPVYFFMLFLLCCAYLWAEKKYLLHAAKLS